MPIALTNGQLDDVGTTQLFPLGTKCVVPAGYVTLASSSGLAVTAADGEQEWVYIFNDEAATDFAAGDILKRDPSVTTYDSWGLIQAPATTFADRFELPAVAQWAIAAGSYGWALVKGAGLLRSGTGNVTADTPLTSGGTSAGCAKDAVIHVDGTGDTRHGVIGFSHEAMATDNALFKATINCGF